MEFFILLLYKFQFCFQHKSFESTVFCMRDTNYFLWWFDVITFFVFVVPFEILTIIMVGKLVWFLVSLLSLFINNLNISAIFRVPNKKLDIRFQHWCNWEYFTIIWFVLFFFRSFVRLFYFSFYLFFLPFFVHFWCFRLIWPYSAICFVISQMVALIQKWKRKWK